MESERGERGGRGSEEGGLRALPSRPIAPPPRATLPFLGRPPTLPRNLSLSIRTLAFRRASFWPHDDAANFSKACDSLSAAASAVFFAARGRPSSLKSVRARRLKLTWRRVWPGASTRA
jgi:hypothetical protein